MEEPLSSMMEFFEWAAKQTNKHASYCHVNRCDSKWEGANVREIEAYIDVLIYMGLTV